MTRMGTSMSWFSGPELLPLHPISNTKVGSESACTYGSSIMPPCIGRAFDGAPFSVYSCFAKVNTRTQTLGIED